MPEISTVQGGVVRSAGAVAGTSSRAITITGSASANAKGAATELIAATEFDASWMLVQILERATGANYLIDIMIGAATEQVIIPDLVAHGNIAGAGGGSYLFPIYVPKGSRLSAKCQSSSASGTIDISITLIAGTLLGGGNAPSYVSGYGVTTNSTGTNVDPGAVADTDSAWTEITAATDRAHNWLCIGGRWGDTALTAAVRWRASIGIGAATEQVLIPDLHFVADATGEMSHAPNVCLPIFIPAGSRLTAKVRSSVTTDGDRDAWLRLYGAG